MALPLLQTELSAFWGLIHVSAKFSSPIQQVQDSVIPKKSQGEGSSKEELLFSESGEREDIVNTSEPASAASPMEPMVPAQLDGGSDRSFRLSSQTTRVVESKDASHDTSSSTVEPVAEKEVKDSSATPTPSVDKRKGNPRHLSNIMPLKFTERGGSLRSKAESVLSRESGLVSSKRFSQEESAFSAFRNLCAAQGLLKRPEALGKHDVPEGINDDATLRYAFFHSGAAVVFGLIIAC